MNSQPDVIDEVFSRSLFHATGGKVTTPRPQQQEMVDWIDAAMTERSHAAIQAPVGSGKSLSYLVPAFVRVAKARERGRIERTVIITQGLGLQRQLMGDCADVIAAVNEVMDVETSATVLKGFVNYVCRRTALMNAQILLGPSAPADRDDVVLALITLGKQAGPGIATIRGRDYDREDLIELFVWTLENDEPRDKDSCPVETEEDLWHLVSTSKDKCIATKCAFFDECAPYVADQNAAEADVVITNHKMAAIQAAKGVPTVINRSGLGEFEHVIVDEAHSLPGVVRESGTITLGMTRVLRLIDRVRSATARYSQKNSVERVLLHLQAVAEDMDLQIQRILAQNGVKGESEFSLDRDESYETLEWIEAVLTELSALRNVLPKDKGDDELSDIRKSRGLLVGDLRQVARHRAGCARWVSAEEVGFNRRMSISFSPVRVSFALRDWIWTKAGDPEMGQARSPMSVIALSGTLPSTFPSEAGLDCEVQHVPTPYADAYAASALYVPSLSETERERLRKPNQYKLALNLNAHRDWATEQIEQLVEANAGSAMVICATAAAGKSYAKHLRAIPHRGYDVVTQWDSSSAAPSIAKWKADTSAVIIGVRTLMTGIDAPGETNTLVVIDRPSRAAGNPVNDARAVQLAISQGISNWDATTGVYVQDAAVLLEQAAGRLIRRATDTGMVAVLDPRIVDPQMSYDLLTRELYSAPLKHYGAVTYDLDTAKQWLNHRRSGAAVAVPA